ncbi:MAG: cellulase family glycosylhydrolase [candidate division Zixibacteria bacterium]|nr:cellulase family glycosylhydrolase [candidate division Zixibacteria bacterium]
MNIIKIPLIALFTLTTAVGVLFVNSRQENVPPPKPTDFLRIEGKKIIDETGNEIFLRGFNIGPVKFASYKDRDNSLEKIDAFNDAMLKNYISEWDIKNMKDMGANVLRAHSYLRFYTLETEPYQYDEGYIKTLDDLIDMAYAQGIYVIITMTGAGQNTHQNTTNQLGNSLWTNKDLRKRVIAAWRYLAEHFANHPGVAGYDILNEPRPGSKEALHSFYEEVVKAIRQVDRNHIIVLSAHYFHGQSAFSCGGEFDDDNILLQIHQYGEAPRRDIENAASVAYPHKSLLKQGLQKLYRSWHALQRRPLFVGEFSAVWDSGEDGLRWTEDMIELMNQRGIHWTYFSYKNIFGKERGLYIAKEWWQKDMTDEQKANLHLGKQQKRLLSTRENYKVNPAIKKILEDGFESR